MKKLIRSAAYILCGMLLSAAIFTFTDIGDKLAGRMKMSVAVSEENRNGGEAAETSLLEDALAVSELLRDRDYTALAKCVHPEKGVYFIPYSTVNKDENQHFNADEVALFADDKRKYVWGTVDGEGSPIMMTPAEYFNRYVYDKNFRTSSVIGLNTIVRSGNMLENVKEVFPDAEFVELHDPGSEEYEGIDWKSLKLVFEKWNGERKLVAVIHGEWTV